MSVGAIHKDLDASVLQAKHVLLSSLLEAYCFNAVREAAWPPATRKRKEGVTFGFAAPRRAPLFTLGGPDRGRKRLDATTLQQPPKFEVATRRLAHGADDRVSAFEGWASETLLYISKTSKIFIFNF